MFIRITNQNNAAAFQVSTEEIGDPWSIVEISGLGAPRSQINITPLAGEPGGVFDYAHMESREIVITLALKHGDAEMAETLSEILYCFEPGAGCIVDLFAEDGGDWDRRIYGVMQAPEYSTSQSPMKVQLVIECPDPLFMMPALSYTHQGAGESFSVANYVTGWRCWPKIVVDFPAMVPGGFIVNKCTGFSIQRSYGGDADIFQLKNYHFNGTEDDSEGYAGRLVIDMQPGALTAIAGRANGSGEGITNPENVLGYMTTESRWFTFEKRDRCVFAYAYTPGMLTGPTIKIVFNNRMPYVIDAGSGGLI